MDAHVRIQRLCVWAGPIFIVLYALAFWGLAGYLPPQPPSLTPADLVTFYGEHRNSIRAGQILCMIFSTLLIPWFGIISLQIARIEGRMPILAMLQFGGGVLLVVFFQLCSVIWIAATYRIDIEPLTLRTMHETSWLIFVMVFPAYTLQLFCIGIAGLIDRNARPIFPRWVAFFNLWVGIGGGGGVLAVFFYSGPFAWNGLIGFWIPVAFFASWLCIMVPILLRNIATSTEASSGLSRNWA